MTKITGNAPTGRLGASRLRRHRPQIARFTHSGGGQAALARTRSAALVTHTSPNKRRLDDTERLADIQVREGHMAEPRIEISGPEAEETRAELEAWWKTEMGEALQRVTAGPGSAKENARGPDPVAVTALVLAIPSAIVATLDLVKRIELTKRVNRWIDWVREKRAKHPKVRIVLLDKDGRPLDVAKAQASDVFEVLEGLGLREPRAPSRSASAPKDSDK
ncbi:MAG: hypothetical protein IPK82_20200 [Polyangiaceae bacterium]|nr:hypothetical protein [Polyangiaceae bacterium]